MKMIIGAGLLTGIILRLLTGPVMASTTLADGLGDNNRDQDKRVLICKR